MAQTIQILRTSTNNPPSPLLPGALSAELGPQTKLWIGSGSGNRLLLSSDPADSAAAAGNYLKLAGGTMTGPIVLSGNAVAALNPVPLQQLNTKTANYLPLLGGTLTGPLLLSADPSANLEAATKQYVDTHLPPGTTCSDIPPAGPKVGQLWWDSAGGQLYVWYDDTVGPPQWVAASNMAGVANAATKLDVAGALNNVGRNLLHNPLFNIAQRGTGPFTAGGVTTLDRWRFGVNTDTFGVTQTIIGDVGRTQIGDEEALFCMQNIFTGSAVATAFTSGLQCIENVRRLAGKTVTVSFYANSVATLKLGVSLDQVFGTGGSPSAEVDGNGAAVTLSTTWTRYSVTLSLPTIVGKTLGTNNDHYTALRFWYSSGANNAPRAGSVGVQSGTINIWGVQLEIGSVATPLEKPDPQQDLAKCQRFFATGQVVGGGPTASTGQTLYVPYSLPVTMRSAPTIVITNNSSNNLSAPAATVTNPRDLFVSGTAATSAGTWLNVAFTASADL